MFSNSARQRKVLHIFSDRKDMFLIGASCPIRWPADNLDWSRAHVRFIEAFAHFLSEWKTREKLYRASLTMSRVAQTSGKNVPATMLSDWSPLPQTLDLWDFAENVFEGKQNVYILYCRFVGTQLFVVILQVVVWNSPQWKRPRETVWLFHSVRGLLTSSERLHRSFMMPYSLSCIEPLSS